MLHTKGGTYDYARNWYYFRPWQTTRIHKAQRKAQGCITNELLQRLFFFLHLWPSELQTLVKHKRNFQNVDAYHQVYITNSKTQPSASILFNKALDINTHPLKPKTLKTLHFWWRLSKFRESKGYLRRQYEHGTYTAINTKAANFLFSPYVNIQKRAKRQEQGKNDIPYQTWMLDTTRFRATLVWR